MSGWRYLAQRLTGNPAQDEFIDLELPLSNVSIESVLTGQDALTAEITPKYRRLIAPDGLPLLDRWGTAIYAEHEGEIVGGGIYVNGSFNGPQWTLECIGFTGYAQDMPYVGSYAFPAQTEAMDIVRHIWAHIQSQRGGNIGLELTPPGIKSGLLLGSEMEVSEFDTEDSDLVLDDQRYGLHWYETHDLFRNLEELSELTPFDWRERHQWHGDRIRHFLELGTPSLGRRREELRFVVGENVFVEPSQSYAAEDWASEVLLMGQGDGRQRLRGGASRPTGGRLRRVAIVDDPQIKSTRAATETARAELAAISGRDPEITEISVREAPGMPLAAVEVGDEILVEGDLDWGTLETWVRVTSRTITPADGDMVKYGVIPVTRLAA